jgi:hypothetical protein
MPVCSAVLYYQFSWFVFCIIIIKNIMNNNINKKDNNNTQQHIPQPDPVVSSGANSYLEKDPDEWKTGTEFQTNKKNSKSSAGETGKLADNLTEEKLPETGEKVSGSNAEKDPDEWVTGSEPMTGAQKSYLKTLSDEAGEVFDENLSKAEASKRIGELQLKTGRGLNK